MRRVNPTIHVKLQFSPILLLKFDFFSTRISLEAYDECLTIKGFSSYPYLEKLSVHCATLSLSSYSPIVNFYPSCGHAKRRKKNWKQSFIYERNEHLNYSTNVFFSVYLNFYSGWNMSHVDFKAWDNETMKKNSLTNFYSTLNVQGFV